MQKIYIQNNGPVKEFEMEIKSFNVLIGEQATGKSTIAKSIYFFRAIKTTMIDYLTQVCDTGMYKSRLQDNNSFDKAIRRELQDIFIRLFGYSWDLNPELKMKCEYADNIAVQVALYTINHKQLIGVNYSDVLFRKLDALRKDAWEIYQNDKGTITSLALTNERRKRNHEAIVKKVNEIFEDDKETYYIPAGRSLLTVMSSNRAMMNSATNLDLITEQFMMMIDSVRNVFNRGVKKAHLYYPIEHRSFDVSQVAELIVAIQRGEYFSDKGKEYLAIKEDTHPVAINFASSGQQEVLWLLNFLYILLLRQEKAFVIIEEPEAHIYPALQKELMEFITTYVNLLENSVLLTTHSPYILTVTNNLYYAGVLTHDGYGKAVDGVVSKKKVINYGELSAYKLLGNKRNGEQKYQELLDEDCREIRSSMIDEVSEQINEMYTALYNIELDHE